MMLAERVNVEPMALSGRANPSLIHVGPDALVRFLDATKFLTRPGFARLGG